MTDIAVPSTPSGADAAPAPDAGRPVLDLLGFFDAAVAADEKLLRSAPPTTWEAVSGTGGWTGRQVLEHLLAVNAQARAMAAGVDVREDGSTPDPLDDADPLGSYRRSAAATREVFADPDVQVRRLRTPMGMFTGRVVASVTSLENLVHGWDLSVAAGAPSELDPVVVGYAARAVEDMPEVWHNFWHWGAYARPLPVPAGATPTAALLALLGRDAGRPGRSGETAGTDPRTSLQPGR